MELIGRENREGAPNIYADGKQFTYQWSKEASVPHQANRLFAGGHDPAWTPGDVWEGGHERQVRAKAVRIVTRHVEYRSGLTQELPVLPPPARLLTAVSPEDQRRVAIHGRQKEKQKVRKAFQP